MKEARTGAFLAFALGVAFSPWQVWAQDWATGGAPLHAERKSPAAGRVVSVDLLQHPIGEKPRRMLQKALQMIDAGKHQAAIEQLQQTLAKYPESAAYADSMIGIEYLKMDQFAAAVSSLEDAVSLLPHDAVNRYNLGLSLVCSGDYKRGEQEVRRALEMDPKNATMQALLDALVERKNSGK